MWTPYGRRHTGLRELVTLDYLKEKNCGKTHAQLRWFSSFYLHTRCQFDVTESDPGLFGTATNAEWLFLVHNCLLITSNPFVPVVKTSTRSLFRWLFGGTANWYRGTGLTSADGDSTNGRPKDLCVALTCLKSQKRAKNDVESSLTLFYRSLSWAMVNILTKIAQ